MGFVVPAAGVPVTAVVASAFFLNSKAFINLAFSGEIPEEEAEAAAAAGAGPMGFAR